VLNPQDHPTAKVGDVVEIYAPEDENGTHLLLQITELNEQSKTGRNVISIESCIATAFKMRSYSNVVMQIVNPADVALDSIEITFKDQYMGRSEMWRLKTYLVSSVSLTKWERLHHYLLTTDQYMRVREQEDRL